MLKKLHSKKGFTLIELLIVVAIIAILAAIAIPQFSAYRIRGFNASANSDVRNLATTQEALFADTQGYGTGITGTLTTTNLTTAGKALVEGPMQAATNVEGTIGAMISNGRGSVGFALGNGVNVVISGSIPSTANGMYNSYVLVSKHTGGDRCFGRDSDSSSMYSGTSQPGTAAATSDAPTANIDTIDFSGNSGSCQSWIAL